MSYIKIESVSKKLSNRLVLNSINLDIDKGKIYGFVGHNGSGKTMLFRAICNFITPTEGAISIDGIKIEKNREYPVSLGAIIEYPGFIDEYTGRDNLKYLASIKGEIGANRIDEVIRTVGLESSKNLRVKKYSLGMRQRLGIAQAIMEYPDILILDEPINALDDEGIKMFKQTVLKLKEDGCTVLIATHTKEILNDIFDYVIKMQDGRVVENEKK